MNPKPVETVGERLSALRASLSRTALTARAARTLAGGAGRGRRGMTLMEVMIVIAIILLMTGVLAYGLGSLFGEAQGDTARLQIQRIDERVRLFQIKKHKLPTDLKDVFKDEEPPRDPWGHEYVFRAGGGGKRDYDIISLGKDGQEGGKGTDADIKLSDDDAGGGN